LIGKMACEVQKCKQEEEINYLGHWLCDDCWEKKSNGKKLKIKYNKVI